MNISLVCGATVCARIGGYRQEEQNMEHLSGN